MSHTIPRVALMGAALAMICGLNGCATAPKESGAQASQATGTTSTSIGKTAVATGVEVVRKGTEILIPRDTSRLTDPKLREVFGKKTANGADLYDALTELRAEMQRQKSVKAWVAASTAAQNVLNQVVAGASFKQVAAEELLNLAVRSAIEEMRSRALTYGYQALDQHFTKLLGADMRSVLAQQTIDMPNPAGLNDAGARRLLTMATMVAAARVTTRVLDDAEKDFKNLEPDYKHLLEQREKAAELLFRLIDARRAAQRAGDNNRRRQVEQSMLAQGALTQNDLRYIDTAMSTMSLAEFVDDMGAQNLALRYLQAADKKAFEGYSAKRNVVVSKTDAYIKAVSGVGAFAGFAALFSEALSDQFRSRPNNATLITMAPVFADFVLATVPLVERTGSVALRGATFPAFLQRNDLFVVKPAGGEDQPVKSAADVFKAVKAAGATDLFSGVFFREDGMGWLNGVRRCDGAEAGRLVDSAVPRVDRSNFATAYFGTSAKDMAGQYSFVNAFTAPALGEREDRLGDLLLGRDHRKRTSDKALTDVQNKVSSNYGEWSNQQLLRLIFSNRDASFAHANVDLGRLAIRPKPSPEAVYVFESYINACVARTEGRPAQPPAAGPRSTSNPATTTRQRPPPAPAPAASAPR